uniref:Macro domain-containing protein n=1 Tax=Gouania willdenowi TaxID=441366 RepID=A0A8C5G090_GOUWI
VAVYSELGTAIVVGEKSKVEAKLAALETELRVVEKRIKFRRLSVAKLRLLWPQIKWSVEEKVPGGDITKQCADALVNAANEQLDHAGGVAAALSRAGGPQVQKESTDIIKQNGQILTGNAVVTTGGNLSCKKLLHAVGPVMGQHGGRERELLKSAVRSSLDLAETMKLKSIVIPCISSGLFGVPIPVCAEAIVSAVKEFGLCVFCMASDSQPYRFAGFDPKEAKIGQTKKKKRFQLCKNNVWQLLNLAALNSLSSETGFNKETANVAQLELILSL